MYHKTLADGFFIFASLALFSAMVGWAVGDIWLASTQWMLVAIVLLLIAIYVRMSADDDEQIVSQKAKPKTTRSSKTKAAGHRSFTLSH